MAATVDALRATLVAQGLSDTYSASDTIGVGPSQSLTSSPATLPKALIGEGGEFEPRKELGRGGVGVVELARQRSLDRDVAIKRLAVSDVAQEAQLLHEAMIAGKLEHPNIVPVHLVVADERGPAVVMKRISGVEWGELIQAGETPLERHLEILVQVCSAVAFAHSRGVLHRDIKPSNVMIGEFDEVYLVDWGLGRTMHDGRCETHGIAGTPTYMAPEMVAGTADVRSDVFLLGATLHELLTGETRHRGGNVVEVLSAALHCLPFEYDDGLPVEVVEVCRRGCAKDPEARYESALALRDAVREYLDHRAANQLVRAAQERADRLAELCGERADYADVQRVFSEARFGFEQALRAWPDNPEARAAQRRCVLRMIEYELDLAHPENAAALIKTLDDVPAEHRSRLEALREAREHEKQRLDLLERDRDPEVGVEARDRATMFLAAGVCALVVGFVSLRLLRPTYASSSLRLLLVGSVVFGVAALVVLRWRRQSPFNLINLRIAQIVLGTLGLSVLNRLLGYVRGADVGDILRADALVLVGCGLALMPFHRVGRGLVVLAVIVATVGAWKSQWLEPLFIGVAVVVSMSYLALRRGRK